MRFCLALARPVYSGWRSHNPCYPRATSLPEGRIDYKELRKINSEAARRAVLEYLKTNRHDVSQAALMFGINRTVVYDIIRKGGEGDLRDHIPNYQWGAPDVNSRFKLIGYSRAILLML